MKVYRIVFGLFGLAAVYYAGVGYRKWHDHHVESAAVEATKDLVTLYAFMGMKDFSFEGRARERKSGYVKVVMPDGQIYEHSGRYSIITSMMKKEPKNVPDPTTMAHLWVIIYLAQWHFHTG
jgi:hypothetical protein